MRSAHHHRIGTCLAILALGLLAPGSAGADSEGDRPVKTVGILFDGPPLGGEGLAPERLKNLAGLIERETALLTRAGRGTLSVFANGGNVVIDVDRASDILEVIRFGNDFGLKVTISGGAEAWMVAEQLAAANIAVMLNPLVNLPFNFDGLGARLDNAALLDAAGVTVIINGAGSHQAAKLRQMAGNAVSYGLSHEAGLAAMTSNPARVFGVSNRQGSIKRNMPANVVLWSGDPLEVTSFAEVVIIDGKLMSMESRQTKLRDRYLPQNPDMPRAYIKP